MTYVTLHICRYAEGGEWGGHKMTTFSHLIMNSGPRQWSSPKGTWVGGTGCPSCQLLGACADSVCDAACLGWEPGTAQALRTSCFPSPPLAVPLLFLIWAPPLHPRIQPCGQRPSPNGQIPSFLLLAISSVSQWCSTLLTLAVVDFLRSLGCVMKPCSFSNIEGGGI